MLDQALAQAVQMEADRQARNIELIASENFASAAVMEAAGSLLTNKYAEGYPGKRYYGGCEAVDDVEQLAIDRAKELFGADHANVQPHSGSQANMAVYLAVLKPGDTVMGMDLSAGGHLTHGHPLNFSGTLYNFVSYGVDREYETIDYEVVRQVALEHKPKMIVAGASAYARTIDFKRFKEIADEVGAYLMVDMAHIAGLVATGEHPSPIPYADFVTSTTHKTLRGPRGGLILCKAEYAQAIDKAVFPGVQGGPLMHIIAAKAACFYEALQPSFKTYQHQVVLNAKAFSDALEKEGFRIISKTTDNHLVLVECKQSKGITGKALEKLCDQVGITLNKNAIPFDEEKPFTTSGVRVGTAAMTTKGFLEEDFVKVAQFMREVCNNKDDEAELARIRDEAYALVLKHQGGY